MGSVVVGDQGSCDGLGGGAVVPDSGGEREQPLGDAGGHAGEAASAVQVQVELAFEGVVDGFDELADRGQQVLARPRSPVAQRGAQQLGAAGVQVVVQFGGDVALVGQQQQAGAFGEQVGVGVQDTHEHLALIQLGIGQCPGDRQT